MSEIGYALRMLMPQRERRRARDINASKEPYEQRSRNARYLTFAMLFLVGGCAATQGKTQTPTAMQAPLASVSSNVAEFRFRTEERKVWWWCYQNKPSPNGIEHEWTVELRAASSRYRFGAAVTCWPSKTSRSGTLGDLLHVAVQGVFVEPRPGTPRVQWPVRTEGVTATVRDNAVIVELRDAVLMKLLREQRPAKMVFSRCFLDKCSHRAVSVTYR